MPGSLHLFLDQQRPHYFLWVPVLLGAGIATYFALRVEPVIPLGALIPVLLLAGLAAFRATDHGLRLLFGAVLVFALGLCLASWRANHVAAPVLTDDFFGAVEGRVVHIDRSASNRVRLSLDRVVLYGMEPEDTPARVRISLSKSANRDVAGDRVLVYARLSGPNGPVEPGGFDFRRMAWFQRLGAIGYALGPVLPSMTPEPESLGARILRLRMDLSAGLQARIPGASGGFASAILTGDRSGVDPAMLGHLRASNLAHLLAISGLHMGLLTGLVFAATRLGLAAIPRVALHLPAKKIGAVAAVLAGLAYLVLSGASVATQRAFVMACVVFVAVLLDRPAFTLRAVALAALLILLIRPESLTGAGFQMSFAATIGLVAAFDLLRRQRWWTTPRTRGGRFLRGIAMIAFTSAVAGTATAPISAFHFNQIAQYGLLANVLAVPVMGFVIMPAALVGIALAPLGLDAWAFWVTGQGIDLVLGIAAFVAGLDGALVLIPSGPFWSLPVVALGGLLLAFLRGQSRIVGPVVISAGLLAWAMADRPDILIDPTARLAGIKTEAGRALSRARGAGYAASTWLENDGDGASQRFASQRAPALDMLAAKGVRFGWIDEATNTQSTCKTDQIVLITKGKSPAGDCLVIDRDSLARTGSVAIYAARNGPRIVTAAAVTGQRLWVQKAQ